jgi:RNA polymerase sigma factor (TIGR02999 family)
MSSAFYEPVHWSDKVALGRLATRVDFRNPENKLAQLDISELLRAWSEGDQAALDQLIPLVYNELRRMAAGYLRRRGAQNSLQPTAVVHEVYLRLLGQRDVQFESRAQFFGLASHLIRTVLVDHVRQRQAAKRGGGWRKVELTEALDIAQSRDVDMIALDHALETLSARDPQQGRIVELRYFGGLTIEDTAKFLKISPATVKRDWNLARAWLYREIIGSI